MRVPRRNPSSRIHFFETGIHSLPILVMHARTTEPFVLVLLRSTTEGEGLRANYEITVTNAGLSAQFAVALVGSAAWRMSIVREDSC
jgi:hypothetical protein